MCSDLKKKKIGIGIQDITAFSTINIKISSYSIHPYVEKTFEMFVYEDKRDPKGIDLTDRLERCSTFHLRHVQFYSGFKLLDTKVGHQQWGEIL